MNDKIIKLLRLADSPNNHEAISAYRHARALMQKENIDWSSFSYDSSKVKSDLVKLMQQKLQLQKEVYDLQDQITRFKFDLDNLKKRHRTEHEVKQGYSDKTHVAKRDIDDAFSKIFDALNRFGPKKNDFIQSLKDQWDEKGWLSPKQVSCLRENFTKFTGFEPAW
jgi:predicted  nucleic acid-binding Zn-ribbon protein